MYLKCLLGFHAWLGCRCARCRLTRDLEHDWSKDCERCAACGAVGKGSHDWEGCRCRRCGAVRGTGHRWRGCQCRECGEQRDQEHRWGRCRCAVCGKTRSRGHEWEDGRCQICGLEITEVCPSCRNARLDHRCHCAACGGTFHDAQEPARFCRHCRVTIRADWPDLLAAAQIGDLRWLRALLRDGANPNEGTRRGWTALHEAIEHDDWEAAGLLLDGGANPHARCPAGSPCGIALLKGKNDLAELMLDLAGGPDVEIDETGNSPLQHAASCEDGAEYIRFLLKQGADPLRRNAEGQTALHYAARAGCEENLALLYQAGGYPPWGVSAAGPLELAAEAGNYNIVALICGSGAKVTGEEKERAYRAALEGEYYLCASSLRGEQSEGDIRLTQLKERRLSGQGKAERHPTGRAKL